MAKVPLSDVNSRYGSVGALNANFDSIQQGFENTLSRDGTGPNAMEVALDMNGNDILNISNLSVTSLSINGQLVVPTGTAITALPGQAGQSGKYLYTNGTAASWRPLEWTPAGATPRTVQDKLRDVVSVKDFGAVGDNLADDTAAMQAALNYVNGLGGGMVYVPRGTYRISAPLLLYAQTALVGEGGRVTKILKTNNVASAIGSILSPDRLPAFSDNYNVDSIISVVHAASAYANGVRIQGINLFGNNNTYGIFFPRGYEGVLHDLIIDFVQIGVFARDVFMTEISRVSTVTCPVGFEWALDGSGFGTGTSVHWSNCFVNGPAGTGGVVAYGFKLAGLNYSTLTNCGVDNINSAGTTAAYSYSFISCKNIVLNGCATETTVAGQIFADNSAITLVGFDGSFGSSGKTFAGTVALLFANSSRMTLIDCTWPVISSPGNIYNILTQNGSHIVATNCVMPTGGDTFNNFSGGSTITEFINGVQTVKTGFGVTRTYRTLERDRVTFSGGTTATVTFAAAEVDANYFVALSANANKAFWITGKTVNGFTVNASAASSDTVEWMLTR